MIENVLQRFATDPKYAMPEIQGWFENWYNVNPTTCRRILGGDVAEAAPVNPSTPEEFAKMPTIANMTKINRSLHVDYELRFKNGKITLDSLLTAPKPTGLPKPSTTDNTGTPDKPDTPDKSDTSNDDNHDDDGCSAMPLNSSHSIPGALAILFGLGTLIGLRRRKEN